MTSAHPALGFDWFSFIRPGIGGLLAATGTCLAQAPTPTAESPKPGPEPATAGPAAAPAEPEMPWLIAHTDYRGDFGERAALTGDWGGVRQDMMDKGLRFDVDVVNIVQGNVKGGTDNDLSASGVLNFAGQLDTGKAGLWPGGILTVKAQASYGENHNRSTGALMPVNFGALYPVPGEDSLQLVNLDYTQFLSTWIAVTVGKYSLRDANVFASDENEQFLNTAFNFNPVAGTTVPLSCLGAGVVLLPSPDLEITTLLLDSEGTASQSGFDTAFRRGTTVMQSWQLTVRPFGVTGHQRIGWTYSDRNRVQFTQSPRDLADTIISGDTGALERRSSDYSVFYDFDQFIYEIPGSAPATPIGAPGRGIGFFGRLGFGDDEVNISRYFWSLGLGGRGPCESRPNDSFGVGFYWDSISGELPAVIERRADDEKGVEAYYNFALTPWLHITPDVQVIDPARSRQDTVVVAGVRVRVIF